MAWPSFRNEMYRELDFLANFFHEDSVLKIFSPIFFLFHFFLLKNILSVCSERNMHKLMVICLWRNGQDRFSLMKIRCITSPLQVHYQSITSLLPIYCQCITTLLSDDYQIASLLPECCQLCTSLLPGLDDAGYMLAIHW